MLPEPLAVQVPPPAPAQVQLASGIVAGNVSVTIAPLTALGPAFEATIVYVMDAPGTAVVCPSVLVIPRFACGVSVSVSVALLFDGIRSVPPPGTATVAVLLRVPVADALTVPVSV